MPIQQGGRGNRRLLYDGENTKPVQRMRSDTMSAWDASVLDELMITRVSSRGSATDNNFIESEMKMEEQKMTPKPPTDRSLLIPTPTEGEIRRYQKFLARIKGTDKNARLKKIRKSKKARKNTKKIQDQSARLQEQGDTAATADNAATPIACKQKSQSDDYTGYSDDEFEDDDDLDKPPTPEEYTGYSDEEFEEDDDSEEEIEEEIEQEIKTQIYRVNLQQKQQEKKSLKRPCSSPTGYSDEEFEDDDDISASPRRFNGPGMAVTTTFSDEEIEEDILPDHAASSAGQKTASGPSPPPRVPSETEMLSAEGDGRNSSSPAAKERCPSGLRIRECIPRHIAKKARGPRTTNNNVVRTPSKRVSLMGLNTRETQAYRDSSETARNHMVTDVKTNVMTDITSSKDEITGLVFKGRMHTPKPPSMPKGSAVRSHRLNRARASKNLAPPPGKMTSAENEEVLMVDVVDRETGKVIGREPYHQRPISISPPTKPKSAWLAEVEVVDAFQKGRLGELVNGKVLKPPRKPVERVTLPSIPRLTSSRASSKAGPPTPDNMEGKTSPFRLLRR